MVERGKVGGRYYDLISIPAFQFSPEFDEPISPFVFSFYQMKKLFYFIVALFTSQQLIAQTKTWNGSVSTDWYNAANWTPSGGATAGAPTNTGVFAQPGSITNGGTMDITGSIELHNTTSFTNSVCGKFKITSAFFNQTGSSLANAGFLHVMGVLSNNGPATHTGVVKSASGTIPNSGNASVRVNDTPTPIFTDGRTFNGTVNGIFKDALANESAGSFTAPNTFAASNTLPLGSQSLYAQITPFGNGCVYIIPFVFFYTMPPAFTTQPNNVAVCGSPTSFTVAATDAVSYQWQASTNNGSNWSNLSLPNRRV